MKEPRFFACDKCGTMIGVIEGNMNSIACDGNELAQLVPNSSGAAVEKHQPVVKVEGNRVEVVVGEVEHPMGEEHWIQWIYLQTEKGGQRKTLAPTDAPKAVFEVVDDKPVAVYEYCNLHGLWKTEL